MAVAVAVSRVDDCVRVAFVVAGVVAGVGVGVDFSVCARRAGNRVRLPGCLPEQGRVIARGRGHFAICPRPSDAMPGTDMAFQERENVRKVRAAQRLQVWAAICLCARYAMPHTSVAKGGICLSAHYGIPVLIWGTGLSARARAT